MGRQECEESWLFCIQSQEAEGEDTGAQLTLAVWDTSLETGATITRMGLRISVNPL